MISLYPFHVTTVSLKIWQVQRFSTIWHKVQLYMTSTFCGVLFTAKIPNSKHWKRKKHLKKYPKKIYTKSILSDEPFLVAAIQLKIYQVETGPFNLRQSASLYDTYSFNSIHCKNTIFSILCTCDISLWIISIYSLL